MSHSVAFRQVQGVWNWGYEGVNFFSSLYCWWLAMDNGQFRREAFEVASLVDKQYVYSNICYITMRGYLAFDLILKTSHLTMFVENASMMFFRGT
jgi:hypothetical protein